VLVTATNPVAMALWTFAGQVSQGFEFRFNFVDLAVKKAGNPLLYV
jgi:hypothetical protein